MIYRTLFLLAAVALSSACAFTPSVSQGFNQRTSLQAADSEVDFGELDGKDVRVGIIRTRWNDEHVSNLVDGARKALLECNVDEANIFQTEVPGAYELPFAAKLLALSGTVDAIICTGVLIKGDTMHFEYISDAVAKGIMNIGLTTNTPCIFGVLTCNTEEQVKARSSEDNNHGYDWGKTAVEMSLLKAEAMGRNKKMNGMGFQNATPLDLDNNKNGEEKKRVGFF